MARFDRDQSPATNGGSPDGSTKVETGGLAACREGTAESDAPPPRVTPARPASAWAHGAQDHLADRPVEDPGQPMQVPDRGFKPAAFPAADYRMTPFDTPSQPTLGQVGLQADRP